MDKAHQDGLFIDKSYFIKDEKKPGFRIPERMIQFLIIWMGSWSAGSILINCLNIPVNLWIINLTIFICTGIMFSLFMIPSYDFVKLFFAGLFYGLYFISRLPVLANGFYIMENLVIDRLVACYNYSGYYFEADYYKDVEDSIRLVIMILIPIIIMLTVSIVRNRLVSLTCLILFLPVFISFFLGVIPSEKYLIPYVVSALYLARSGFSLRRTTKGDYLNLLHRINSRVAVCLSVLCLMLFFILKLFVPKEEYSNISGLSRMQSDVQSAFLNLSIEDIASKFNKYKLFEYDGPTGGLRGGELGKDGEVVYTNSEQLIINAPLDSLTEGIYLKGYVGTEYTGDSWKGHTAADRKLYDRQFGSSFDKKYQPVNQMNLLLSQMVKNLDFYSGKVTSVPDYHIFQSGMEVQYKNANKKYIYAPYYTNYDLIDEMRYEQDLYAAPQERKDRYNFNYFYNLALGSNKNSMIKNLKETNKDYAKYEQAYRNYVYQVYTRLPEKGLDRIKKDFAEKGNTLGGTSVFGKIAYVREYLTNNTSYTLAPGVLPKDKDYVEYFLYENKKGYCAHYASAATLMLRTMGVPARYVEGYAIKDDLDSAVGNLNGDTQSATLYTPDRSEKGNMPYVTVKVTDKNAHAWVEVYVDGCGWIPVEFTPGSAIGYNNSVVHDLSNAGSYFDNESGNKTATPTVKPTQAVPTITNPAMDKEKNKYRKDDSSNHSTMNRGNTKLDKVFIISFFLLLFTAVTVLIIIRIKKYRKIRSLTNRNKRALFVFAQTGKILSYCRYLPDRKTELDDGEEYVKCNCPYFEKKAFDNFMKIIKKARFSNENISVYELNVVETFRQNLFNEAYKELTFGKKIYLKIILLM